MNKAISWVLVVAAIGGAYFFLSKAKRTPPVITNIIVPEFSPQAALGEVVFQGSCAACHGANLAGTESGPPLVAMVYRPAIHSDYAIVSAIKNGVVPHHWPLDAMPPQEGISEAETGQIVAYIREMQRANGIN